MTRFPPPFFQEPKAKTTNHRLVPTPTELVSLPSAPLGTPFRLFGKMRVRLDLILLAGLVALVLPPPAAALLPQSQREPKRNETKRNKDKDVD